MNAAQRRPWVLLRGAANQPLRAECGHCHTPVDVTHPTWRQYLLDWHDVDNATCPGSGAPVE